ncbi:right-handed parallel beta-helix repeat-containing protein [Myxococcota bacterium]
MRRAILVAVSLAWVLAGCGDDDSGNNQSNSNVNDNANQNDNANRNDNANQNSNTTCPEGTQLSETACVPIFDDCSGETERPVLGGGCETVGVTQCAPGFVATGSGGCEPTLPPSACPPGSRAQLGSADCIPIADCGVSTWGNIPLDATTVFVDASADASGADGSQAAPFVTIGEGYDLVVPGGTIAIAAGEYEERLVLNQPVLLWGRCPEHVTIRGAWFLGEPRAPVTVAPGGTGTEIRQVTLTGDAEGLHVIEAQGLVVEDVEIANTGGPGLHMEDGAEVSLTGLKIAGATMAGIFQDGGILSVTDSLIRDTAPDQAGLFGRGIESECDQSPQLCSVLTLSAVIITGNTDLGVYLGSTTAQIEGSLIESTAASLADGGGGLGLAAYCDPTGVGCSDVTLEGSVVRRNGTIGLISVGGVLDVNQSVFRETQPEQGTLEFGWGLGVQCEAGVGECGNLNVSNSLVEANRERGISIYGVPATITNIISGHTAPQESDVRSGNGVVAQCDLGLGVCGSLYLSSSVLEDNWEASLLIVGADADLDGVHVRDTQPGFLDGLGGYGISALCDPYTGTCGSVTISGSLIERSATAGLASSGVSGSLSQSSIIEVAEESASGQYGYGVYVDAELTSDAVVFDVAASQIQDAVLSGIFYHGTDVGGVISLTRITGGQYSVILAGGASPEITDDNELSGSVQDEPVTQ